MSSVDAAQKFLEAKLTKTSEATVQANFSLHIGPPGSGKTTILGTMPGKTLILDTEGGTAPLRHQDIDLIQVSSWNEVRQVMLYLDKGKHDYQSFAIDGLTRLQRQLKDAILAANNKSFMDQQLWGTLLEKGMSFIDALDQIRTTRNIHVAVTVLEQFITDDQKGSIVAAIPKLAGGLKDEIVGMFDTAAFHRTRQLEPRDDQEYGDIIFKCLTKPYEIDGCKRIGKDRWGVLDVMEDPDISAWVVKAQTAQGEEVPAADPTPPSFLDTDAVTGEPLVPDKKTEPEPSPPSEPPSTSSSTPSSSGSPESSPPDPEPDSSPTPATTPTPESPTATTEENGAPEVAPADLHKLLEEWYDGMVAAYPAEKGKITQQLIGLVRTAGAKKVTDITNVDVLLKIVDTCDKFGQQIQKQGEK